MKWFTDVIDSYKPQAIAFGHVARAYAERIIGRLDAIHAAVQTEDFDTLDRDFQVTTTAGGSTEDVVTVPPGRDFQLIAVVIPQAAIVSVFDGGRLKFIKNAAAEDTVSGANIPFKSGSNIRCSVSGAVGARAILVFRSQVPYPKGRDRAKYPAREHEVHGVPDQSTPRHVGAAPIDTSRVAFDADHPPDAHALPQYVSPAVLP